MRLHFDALSIHIIMGIFVMLTVFGFMYEYGSDDSIDFNPMDNEPNEVMLVSIENRTLMEIPEGKFTYYDYSWSDMEFVSREFTMWDSKELSVRVVNVDNNWDNVFPSLFTGYKDFSSSLADAPTVLRGMFVIFPLMIMFIAIRSVVIKW